MSEAPADAFEEEGTLPVVAVAQEEATKIDIAALPEEQKAVLGHDLENQIIEDGQHVMARYLRIGRNLFTVSKNTLFKPLGYETFDEWRAQPEMNLSRSTSYALMKVFEVFVDNLKVEHSKLAGIDWTKLYNVSPFVTQENVEEFLDKVRVLSRTDLQREVALMRARSKGKTEAEAEATLNVLDIVREACPINCGGKCGLIDADHDKAVGEFKKYLGRLKGLHAKIRSLFGTPLKRTRKHEQSEDDATPEGTVPTGADDTPAAVRVQPSTLPGGETQSHHETVLCGAGAQAGGADVEGAGGDTGQKRNGSVWPS